MNVQAKISKNTRPIYQALPVNCDKYDAVRKQLLHSSIRETLSSDRVNGNLITIIHTG